MFNFWHKQYHKNETALVFMIESGEVVSALVRFEQNKKPFVYYILREPISLEAHSNPEHLTPFMLYALKKSAEDMVVNGFVEFSKNQPKIPIQKIYVILGCPWYKSGTIFKTIKKDEPFIITSEFLEAEADSFFNLLEVDGAHLEKKIISIKANGYNMQDPLGRKVRAVDLGVYVSIAGNTLVKEIEGVLHMSFPNFPVVFHTISIALYTAMSHILNVKDYLLIIPEQGMTEFVLVSGGIFEASASAPFGKHKIIEYIARELSTTKEESLSLLKLWTEGTLEAEKKNTIETIVLNARNEWTTYVKGALSALGKFVLLPSQIYITGHSPESAILASWLTAEEYTSQTFAIEKFTVSFFSRKDILPFLETSISNDHMSTTIGSSILFLRFL